MGENQTGEHNIQFVGSFDGNKREFGGTLRSLMDMKALKENLAKYPDSLLEELLHTHLWPVDLKAEEAAILSYFSEPSILMPTDDLLHKGIDIFAEAGTPVHAAADGRILILRDDVRGRDTSSGFNALCDVVFYSNTGILYIYAHMDKSTIPEPLSRIYSFSPKYSRYDVQAGEVIGQIGVWPVKAEVYINNHEAKISPEMTTSHLHVETYDFTDMEDKQDGTGVNSIWNLSDAIYKRSDLPRDETEKGLVNPLRLLKKLK